MNNKKIVVKYLVCCGLKMRLLFMLSLRKKKISYWTLFQTKQFFVMTEMYHGSVKKSKSYLIRKILHTNPIFKMVKINNNILSFPFELFKICCYLELKLLNINITNEFLKNWFILVQFVKLIGHFVKRSWPIRKQFAFFQYFIIINSFQTLGIKQHKNKQNTFINFSY